VGNYLGRDSRLLQLRVLGFGLLQDGDVEVGAVPLKRGRSLCRSKGHLNSQKFSSNQALLS
jgi:hypothetical protein